MYRFGACIDLVSIGPVLCISITVYYFEKRSPIRKLSASFWFALTDTFHRHRILNQFRVFVSRSRHRCSIGLNRWSVIWNFDKPFYGLNDMSRMSWFTSGSRRGRGWNSLGLLSPENRVFSSYWKRWLFEGFWDFSVYIQISTTSLGMTFLKPRFPK